VEYTFEKEFIRKLAKLKKKDSNLYQKVLSKLKLFKINDKHPSLRCHKLTGKLNGYWSISMDMGIRMIYWVINDTAYFVDIGTHEEVYRVN
jgi:addiction module RelE/StbE family toxin